MSENQRLTVKAQSVSEHCQRASQALEQRALALERDLELARVELGSVQSEYESYKVSTALLHNTSFACII